MYVKGNAFHVGYAETVFRNVVLTLLVGILIMGCGVENPIVEVPADDTHETSERHVVFAAAPSLHGDSAFGEIETIENVYDGDTIKDVKFLICDPCQIQNPLIPLRQEGEKIYFVSDVRIKGIDTPELRPTKGERSQASVDREKALAIQARDYLRHLLSDAGSIRIENQGEDKYYGRIVADVIVIKEGVSMNVGDRLISCGYAVAYDGGTKTMDWGAAGISPTCPVPVGIDLEAVVQDPEGVPNDDIDPEPEADASRIVYRTKTGAKYHHEGCPHLRKSAIPVTIAVAESLGLGPCNLFR